jgi:TIR domain
MPKAPNKKGKATIFVSHISSEATLATALKAHISEDFLGQVDVFVSSDLDSIPTGESFLEVINQALREASALLVLCSHVSIYRPWVNFEVGAASMRGIPIVPICHSGLRPSDLPVPLAVVQCVEANTEPGLRRVYQLVAEKLCFKVPRKDFSGLLGEVAAFEQSYAAAIEASRWLGNTGKDDAAHRLLGKWKSTWFIETDGKEEPHTEVFHIQRVCGNRFFGSVISNPPECCECKLEGVWNEIYLQVLWSPPRLPDSKFRDLIDFGCYFLERQPNGSYEGYAVGFFWNINRVGTYRQTLTRMVG